MNKKLYFKIIDEYFNYFKNESDRQESAKTKASTLDGEIEYILKTKEEKLEIKRNQEFIILNNRDKRGISEQGVLRDCIRIE